MNVTHYFEFDFEQIQMIHADEFSSHMIPYNMSYDTKFHMIKISVDLKFLYVDTCCYFENNISIRVNYEF